MTHPLIAKQRIEEAQQSFRNVANKRLEEQSDNRRSYENFYRHLALLSGGTVALSVTYLGFLKTVSNQAIHPGWLIASWVMLFVCLVCATYYSFFNTSYTHYARNREYVQRLKEQHETLAEELPNVNIAGIQTKAEFNDYVNELREAAKNRGKNVRWNERKEKLHEFMFRACAITARLSFVVGIALLLLFAVANINTRYKTNP